MKSTTLFLWISLSFSPVLAQLNKGFDKDEARDMIALCNSFTFIDLYNDDQEILPSGYEKRYSSGVFGMDNKFQIYVKERVAVINFRGSTDKKISWLQNIHSAMIPATGVMEIAGETFHYHFADDTAAAVHSGYALGIAYLQNDILYHINVLNREGIYDIIITGHSQGGALANVMRAYLEHLPEHRLSRRNQFKTYAFAAPMVGNKAFVEEYNQRFCDNQTSFNIVIPYDPVPTFPLNYNENTSLADNLKTMLFDPGSFDFKKMMTDGLFNMFEESLGRTAKKLTHSATGQISKDLGHIVLPAYKDEFNYQYVGNRIELPPVEYPKFLRDSTILQNDSLMAVYKRGPDGHFLNQEVYKKEGWAYQHKPYNYYVSMLKKYFPREYALLDKKYLDENL